jgi:hypothetical protein
MNKTEVRWVLSRLFVPRAKESGGVYFSSEFWDDTAPNHKIFLAVRDAQIESELTFHFSFQIASRAANILADCEDWDDPDQISEAVDAAVPVYNYELAGIYAQNSHVVDTACKELGGWDKNSMERAALGWYYAIDNMVHAIAKNLKAIIETKEK